MKCPQGDSNNLKNPLEFPLFGQGVAQCSELAQRLAQLPAQQQAVVRATIEAFEAVGQCQTQP